MYLLQSCLWPQGQRSGLVWAPGGLASHGLVSEAGHEAGDGHHQPQHRGRVVLGRRGGQLSPGTNGQFGHVSSRSQRGLKIAVKNISREDLGSFILQGFFTMIIESHFGNILRRERRAISFVH